MPDALLLVSDPRMLAHDPGPDHPESSARLRAVVEALRREPIAGARWMEGVEPVSDAAALRVHTPEHLAALEALRGRSGPISPDTAISAESAAAARLAAGAGVAALRAIYSGEARAALVLTRPPGHHAKAQRMMGFCLLNNVAIAAAYARAELGAERVLIIDWDVHHGNGTEAIFWERRDVLVFDSHQSPLYPGTGEMDRVGGGEARGFQVNVPVPAGTSDGELLAIYRGLLGPIAAAYQPDLVLVSAGFDGHQRDPLGGLALSERGFAGLCGLAQELAARYAGGRIALFLEGGYDLEALAASARACAEVLAGAAPPADPPTSARAEGLLGVFRAHHGLFWPGLR